MVASSFYAVSYNSSTRPCGNLKAPAVVNALREYVVTPFYQPDSEIAAVRMSWFNKDHDYLKVISENLTQLRSKLDEYVLKLPGLQVCISAVTATRAGKKDGKKNETKIYPGVSYWVVFQKGNFNCMSLCSALQGADDLMGATPKLLLQPYQQSVNDIGNALNSVLKDSMEGCVRKIVDASAKVTLGQAPGEYPIVKAYAWDSQLKSILNTAKNQLALVKLYMEVETPTTN